VNETRTDRAPPTWRIDDGLVLFVDDDAMNTTQPQQQKETDHVPS
jgi:hypothetical protein